MAAKKKAPKKLKPEDLLPYKDGWNSVKVEPDDLTAFLNKLTKDGFHVCMLHIHLIPISLMGKVLVVFYYNAKGFGG